MKEYICYTFFIGVNSLVMIQIKEVMDLKRQYVEMGGRIQLRRKELRIKQSELAEKLDISNNHISSIENGREKPSLEILLRICEELKVTPDFLLLGNMYANNIPQDIIDGLRLCNQEDIEFIRKIVEIMINRNQNKWNEKNYS